MEFLTSAFLAPVFLIGAIPLFIYLYAILRWRAGGGEEPGIGSYGLVLTFRLVSLLLATGALSLLFYAAVSKDDQEVMTRVCMPILVGSLIFLAVQYALGLALGPTESFRAARRIFGGGLVAISGMVTFGALIALLVTLWEKPPDLAAGYDWDVHTERLKGCYCWLICFGVVYLLSFLTMARAVRERPIRGS